jgi:hypothetical protein
LSISRPCYSIYHNGSSVKEEWQYCDTYNWLRAGRFGVRIPGKDNKFYLLQNAQTVWGPHSRLTNGQRRSQPRIKQPGCEGYHSPAHSVGDKSEWSYTSTFPYAFMAWTGTTLLSPCTFFNMKCYTDGKLVKILSRDVTFNVTIYGLR